MDYARFPDSVQIKDATQVRAFIFLTARCDANVIRYMDDRVLSKIIVITVSICRYVIAYLEGQAARFRMVSGTSVVFPPVFFEDAPDWEGTKRRSVTTLFQRAMEAVCAPGGFRWMTFRMIVEDASRVIRSNFFPEVASYELPFFAPWARFQFKVKSRALARYPYFFMLLFLSFRARDGACDILSRYAVMISWSI